MNFREITAYRIRGLVHRTADSVVATDHHLGLTAVLVASVDEALEDADRLTAILYLHANGELRRLDRQAIGERIAAHVANIRSRRSNLGRHAFLVIRREGTLDAHPPDSLLDLGDFSVWIDPSIGIPQRIEAAEASSRLSNALFLALPQIISIQHEGSGLRFITDDRIVYPFRMMVSVGSVYASLGSTRAQLSEIQAGYTSMKSRPDLQRVARLSLASLEATDDPIRAFLTAWAALEVLTQKAFKVLIETFYQKIEGTVHRTVDEHLVDRIREIMKSRYNLVQKFALVAAELSPDTAEADVATFKQLKGQRDEVHSADLGGRQLPLDDLRQLLRRYWAAYLYTDTDSSA